MSLPDGKLTLQGFSQLGTANSKKHAMVVRLSTETMEALERLESGAKIDIDFGEGSSKLHIGDASFTMKTQPETVPHELYLRMVQPNKPGAMLKLQGNVVGKLQVDRQLNDQVETAIRDRTQQAEKQKHERRIELLPAPLAQAPRATQKKPKAASKPTKSTPAGHAPSDSNRTLSSTTSLQPSRVASPRISPKPPANSRYRLIHFVALNPRTHDEIMRLVGGASKESRKEIQDLIPEVLEQVRGSNKYRLKTETWLEIKPFDNRALNAEEVQKLVDQGQEALRRLYIPESDPLWECFRPPPDALAPPTSRTAKSSPAPRPAEPKKLATTKKARPSETTTKRKISDTIPMKDESVRPPKAEAVRVKERAETPTTSALTAKTTARRAPGSGFRAKSLSSTPPSLDNTAAEPQAPLKRPGVDREIKREAPSPVPGSSRLPSSMPPPPGKAIRREEPEVKRKEPVKSSRAADTREKKRPKAEPGEIELSPRKRVREVPESDYSDRDSVASLSFKRRKVEGQDNDRLQVKAEHRDVSAAKKKYRDASPLPAHVKAEREPTPLNRSPVPAPRSPLPPRPVVQDRVASVASNGSRDSRRDDTSTRNGSAKPRRREPSFTSSEDDEPRSKADRKRGRSPPSKTREREREQPKKVATLPNDPRALRRMYDERIPEFVALRSKKKRLRDELKRLDRRMRDDGVDELSTDYEIPDDAECESLHNAEAAAREECVRIRDALYRLTGQEIPEDNGLWSEDTD